MKSQLIGFLMSFCISFSLALYFHSGEREEKCVIEDVPSDTLVTGNYKVQKWDMHKQDFLDSAPGLGMFVTVTTPTAEVILSKLYGPTATFSFTSYLSGEHVICLQSNSTRLVAFAGSKLVGLMAKRPCRALLRLCHLWKEESSQRAPSQVWWQAAAKPLLLWSEG
uniref:GOLD domain-containing protein n=1 Tax=Pavo cristatus TaxID=9049 RepID=A0A8C9G0E7_PAVCR